MTNIKSDYYKMIYQLKYNYFYLVFSVIGILFIVYAGIRTHHLLTVIALIPMVVVLIINMKSIAKVDLNQVVLKLIYHPFYRPKIFEYTLRDIEIISIYYSYKRYHSTILFIKLKDSDFCIKHTTAMSVSNSKKLVEVLRSLNVDVLELEWPKVEGKVVTLP